MKHEVFLSALAERKLDFLLDFLTQEWGQTSKSNYLKKFKRAIYQISKHPRICQESAEMKGVYKCLVTKQSSFYYRIQNDEIEIITVFDNRQDQKTVFEEMKKYFIKKQ